MDDFNSLATLDEIETHYASLDVPIPICWLLNGKLDYLEEETEVQVTFTKGEIRDETYDITANYTLMRYENGYMVYNIIVPINELTVTNGSEELFYDVELPAHFSETPLNSLTFGRLNKAHCIVYYDYNSSHITDYMPSFNLYPRTTGFTTTNGYVIIKMEGF